MKISGNLGIGMERNGIGADPKQKLNASLHSIVVTRLVLAKENISAI